MKAQGEARLVGHKVLGELVRISKNLENFVPTVAVSKTS